MSLKVPRLSENQIQEAAADFSSRYEAERFVFPIEDVVDVQLKMDIIPMVGLRNKMGIDALTTKDFSQITIDSDLYNLYPSRYRFSLAHEVGHLQLHRELFQEIDFMTIQDWVDFHLIVDSQEYDELEKQGNKFAAYLLLPKTKLIDLIESKIPVIREANDQCNRYGLHQNQILDHVINFLAKDICESFGVARGTAVIRIRDDKEIVKMLQ